MKTRDRIYFLVIYALMFVLAMVVFTNEATASEDMIHREIVESAQRHGIDPLLALSIAEIESGFNPNARGSLGEIGLFQLRPEFHPVLIGHRLNNIDVAMRYLAGLKRTCSAYGDAYFVCFNYGPARKLKYPHAFPYYVKVKAAMDRRATTLVAQAN
jgi:soluble lytic murein transglycosylase-like protein